MLLSERSYQRPSMAGFANYMAPVLVGAPDKLYPDYLTV